MEKTGCFAHIGEAIDALAKEQGLSDNALSRLSDVPQPTVTRILNGESLDPRRSNIEKIAAVLGHEAEALYRMVKKSTQKAPAKSICLAKKIQSAREWRGIGKKELADLVGVTPGSVTQWENGNTKGLKATNLFALVEVLGVPSEYFFNPTMSLEEALHRDQSRIATAESELAAQRQRYDIVAKLLVDALAVHSSSSPGKIIDLLTGYLWDSKEGQAIRVAKLPDSYVSVERQTHE